MKTGEYSRVFGAEPFEIAPTEIIVDIGSGMSDLSSLVPEGTVIQLDPIFRHYSQEQLTGSDGRVTKFPVEVGSSELRVRDTLRLLDTAAPSRVTMANTLRYIPPENKARALEQMLHLGRYGLVQLYPYRSANTDEVIETARRWGFEVSVHNPAARSLRQLTYGLGRINSTLTVESQPKKAGPADRSKLAKLIVNKYLI